jgi:hypothetical protein
MRKQAIRITKNRDFISKTGMKAIRLAYGSLENMQTPGM